MYYVPVVTPVEYARDAQRLKGVVNTHRADDVRRRHGGRRCSSGWTPDTERRAGRGMRPALVTSMADRRER